MGKPRHPLQVLYHPKHKNLVQKSSKQVIYDILECNHMISMIQYVNRFDALLH